MKRNLLTIAMGLLLGVMALPVAAQVVNDDNEDGVVKLNADRSKYDYVQGQVLVKFKDETPVQITASRGKFRAASANKVNSVLTKFGVDEMEQLLPNENPKRTMRRAKAFNGTIVRERDLSQLYRIKLSDEHIQEVAQLVDELKGLDEVEFAEPNYLLHTLDATIDGFSGGNPYATSQWYLESYGVTTLWNKPIVNPERPVIAIIDTGVDLTHPDLVPNLWTNSGEVDGEKGYDNDHNGFKNDLHGWDFINNTANVRDYNMHGTHVAGIAAAANNNIGIVGANPRALIMPVSVMQSDGTGDVATIVKGINYAVQNGATVLNLSLGTYANSRALRQALENAYTTAVIVAAAGNDGRCINSPHNPNPCFGAAPMFPAAYSFVLGVQAIQPNGSLAAFSNYDDDGNTFSTVTTLQDPDGFNYELKAPGTNMYSTIPGGKYKSLQGTSMASPLVAGAISALKMVKNYDTQEILWGDLLHSNNIAGAYSLTERPAELDLLKLLFREEMAATEETEEDYSNDGEIDAGETVYIYPVIRTTFGGASNITMYLEMGDEFEDPSTVEILTGSDNKVNFGIHLDAYGKAVSLNPLILRVADNVADNRHIKMKFVAICDESDVAYEGYFTMVVTNMVKINGLISENRTLTADHVYYINDDLGIMEGATLTIEPGTRVLFAQNKKLASFGKLVAKGTPSKKIEFAPYTTIQSGSNSGFTIECADTLRYCIIKGARTMSAVIVDCEWSGCGWNCWLPSKKGERCNLINSTVVWLDDCRDFAYSNVVNMKTSGSSIPNIIRLPKMSYLPRMNYFNNLGDGYTLINYSDSPYLDTSETPPYLGSYREDIVRTGIYEMGNGGGFGQTVLSNMPDRPYSEAHGIVWKVCVNGKDAQDEYEDLAPLGVGKHKFEVYFNRPMNKAVAPQISFGVRDPWTQNVVNEDGEWNEEGTIYTAYKTITGKTKSDGVNRIYVRGAEDDEFFEIPYEKTRFNVMINAAGSMATGFAAEPKMGRVDLTWNNTNNDFDDAMGFNIYRFGEEYEKTLPAGWYDGQYYSSERTITVADTVRLNNEILDIETVEFTDYDVTPGETYHYYYKVLSTDLQEYDVSNVVAATPLTATIGDADGSGDVKVGDVITTVNYILGDDPKPFIFEAADVNTDQNIDVLDVIGIIQMILNQPAAARVESESVAEAVYTIENGVLYVETPVTLGGLQAQISLSEERRVNSEEFATAADMKGFEVASTWLTESDYRLLAYSFGSKTLAPGKHAIMTIGNADITSLRLCDTQGRSVLAVPSEATLINDAMGSKVMTTKGVYNLGGQKMGSDKLRKGVYIINGEKVVK